MTSSLVGLGAKIFFGKIIHNAFHSPNVILVPGEVVPVGGTKSFVFTVTDPSTPGTYTFGYSCRGIDTGAFGQEATVLNIPAS